MYYAKVLSPESTDNMVYLDTFMECSDIIIYGGREFKGYNDDIISQIKKAYDEYDDYYYEIYYHNSIMAYLSDYLPKKDNGKRLSPKEAHDIEEMFKKDNLTDIIIVCLSILKGRPYGVTKLYGCCQGDVVHCFYPDDEKECIPYLNDLYWNLGSEIIVHDTDEPVNNADDIDGYCDYIVHTDYKLTLKEEVAKHLDTTPDNVTLYEFKHYIHVPVYEIAK